MDKRRLPIPKVIYHYVKPTEEEALELQRFLDKFYFEMFDRMLIDFRKEKLTGGKNKTKK